MVKVDIGLIVFRLTVPLVVPFYLNRIVGHNVKILDFFGRIGKNSEKGIGLRLVVELGLFQVESLPRLFPDTIKTELGQCRVLFDFSRTHKVQSQKTSVFSSPEPKAHR